MLKPLEIADLEHLADRALGDAERGLAPAQDAGETASEETDAAASAADEANEADQAGLVEQAGVIEQASLVGQANGADGANAGDSGHGRLLIEPEARRLLAEAADGDARRLLNLLELAAELAETCEQEPRSNSSSGVVPASSTSPLSLHPLSPCIRVETLRQVIEGSVRRFDKGGDAFYDQISALHKSVRGSAPDAALYWLARMIDGGCDPLYIARRLVRMASEDIGNADPRALGIAMDAWDAQQRLGSPEGELALAQAAVYLASAAKSNAVYRAWNSALEDVRKQGSLEVPVHLRNAPTRLMKQLGYGHAYRYAHDEPDAYAAGEQYFPDGMAARRYYQPVERGLEIRIKEKLERLAELDRVATAGAREGQSP
ncbi:MAG: hypothetical protein C1943_16975 [Halochromatium sp.]|nr:hypothetical protein [Halochromatium sp.]